MSVAGLLQIAVDVCLGLALFVMWARLKRPPKDDPRLSRGLQLLQSKITVLEDLSDRSEIQVKQLSELLEQKSRILQTKIFESEKLLKKLDQSMNKSLEVAEIFQDKIPHHEIIERQNTIKYVRAAQLAHLGKAADDIAKVVDLPKEQIEFIAKVNRDQLMFDVEQLPPWAKQELILGGDSPSAVAANAMSNRMEELLSLPKTDADSLKALGDNFREACRQAAEPTTVTPSVLQPSLQKVSDGLLKTAENLSSKLLGSASSFLNDSQPKDQTIKTYQFRKIE